ncbi:hypothetical protein L484_015586 [Morus notabilis]|uniref:Uncharacterized protein n=1 Tax=Morus notabilis TaxID=981085 RepID=W9S2W3_9ROSA|nr:hypothetical protein L484_015586 [Morus notabilis]
METEIIEEKDEEGNSFIDSETQKEKIRRIIEYQKSLYSSSASSSSMSSSAVSSTFSSSARRTNSLLNLMRSGNTSLRRLFDMEHTSLATYFADYSGSPIIKPILLWGSDSENEIYNPWESIQKYRPSNVSGVVGQYDFTPECRFGQEDFDTQKNNVRIGKRKLTRKKAYRRLPRFGLWKCGGFIFKLRLRKFRLVICRRK